ncbi:hypothetical protein I79_004585 [Cricetulus griseus]|uniref:Uncharacterized protein n=1 Tax=Cricetulus griseus TaxID=10029 RepID=G3H2Y0_CRIGR|nr:hypothetical protein I79_004585 [Cricetulus griseus]
MPLIVSALLINPYHGYNISMVVNLLENSLSFCFLAKIWAAQDMGQEEALELEASLKYT